MNSRELRAKLRGLRHPTGEELFLFLDGELGNRKTRRLKAHLRGCWNCRVQVDDMARGMAKGVQLRNDLAEALPGRWDTAQLERRVAQVFEDATVREWRRPFIRYPKLSFQSALTGAAVLVVLLWLHLSSPRPVSANQLYEGAAAAESRLLSPVLEPVVHQTIRISRRTKRERESMTVETWTTGDGGRRAQRGGDGIWQEVAGVLEANRLGDGRPLSASSYRRWAELLSEKKQAVEARELADGSPAWVIRTTVPAAGPRPRLDRAELVFLQADFHPVQQNLHVLGDNGDQEYELTELAYNVVPATSLDPTIFPETQPTELRPNHLSAPEWKPQPATAPALVAPPREPAADLAIQALYVLHQLHRCLGGPFEVVRSGDAVSVQGLVDTEEQKQELLTAFRTLPSLRLEIRTVAEAQSGSTPLEGRPATLLDARREQDYLVALIDKKFPRARLTEISNQAVAKSNAWLLDAWELHRFAEAFPAETVQQLGPLPAGLLENMVRDHAESIASRASEFRAAVQPLFPAIAPEQAAGANATWPEAAAEVFEGARSAQRLAEVLFTGEGALSEPAEAAVQHLFSSVAILEDRARAIESRAAGIFRDLTLRSQSSVRREP
ncbi:MAG: zf-HC2 domain-containing protein [Bryobacterales bacterium]|nr:zf-HC2 domain-containing protein [Bryobacterales bacterium]